MECQVHYYYNGPFYLLLASIDTEHYTKNKADKVDMVLKELHKKAKKAKIAKDATQTSKNTPAFEQGKLHYLLIDCLVILLYVRNGYDSQIC